MILLDLYNAVIWNNRHLYTNHSTLVKEEIWATAHETRESLQQFRFSSLAENWGFHAKLYAKCKYQILYPDSITIVAWRHFVNNIDLCRSPKSPKNP